MIQQIYPLPGAYVGSYDRIDFWLDALPGAVVWVAIGSQVEEVAFRDDAFAPAYAGGSQVSVAVDLRALFSLRRAGGWGGASVRVYASESGSTSSDLDVVTALGVPVVRADGDRVRI
jgi:hypothetical protein